MAPTIFLCFLFFFAVAEAGMNSSQSFTIGKDLKCFKQTCPTGTVTCKRQIVSLNDKKGFKVTITCIGRNNEALATFQDVKLGNKYNEDGVVMEVH